MSTGRNDICPCGSGKKYKKCCLLKKPRITKFTYLFDKPVKVTSLSINDGKFESFCDNELLKPSFSTMTIGYERKKNLKVLNQSIVYNNEIFSDPNKTLLGYDMLYAIDTNTKQIDNLQVSISGIFIGNLISMQESYRYYLIGVKCLEFWNLKECPERFGWKIMIEFIMSYPQYMKANKIGIIVDHNLLKLDDYNNQKEPIINGFYLPEKFKLIYASTDVGKEYLANKLITMCDEHANKFFEHIQKDNKILIQARNNSNNTIIRSWSFDFKIE